MKCSHNYIEISIGYLISFFISSIIYFLLSFLMSSHLIIQDISHHIFFHGISSSLSIDITLDPPSISHSIRNAISSLLAPAVLKSNESHMIQEGERIAGRDLISFILLNSNGVLKSIREEMKIMEV